MKKVVRDLIIGKNNYIESQDEYRKVLLSGQYALISMGVILIYKYIEYPNIHFETLVPFASAFLLALGSIVLHRFQWHCVANYILFSTINLLLFVIASSESISTGAIAFFIPLAMGAFAVFNYSHRKAALGFCIFSFVLLCLTLTQKISLLPYRTYTPAYIDFNHLLNFSIAFAVSVMTIYLLISVNHYNAQQLVTTNKQLTKLNEELDRFVYSTSHDLRAPLLSIKGLLKLSEKASANEQAGYLRLMLKRAENLEKFIREITDYSRNSRLEIVRKNVNVFELAEEIWESLRYGDAALGIAFKNDLPKDLIVVNDERRIKVVLSNLISNAVFYHDPRKEHRYIRLHHQLTDSSFSLHIEDNGQGIAPELQARVFDMFFRGNESSQGSGLGLYIVQETLTKLSGNIRLQSIPQEGSTFSITLPING